LLLDIVNSYIELDVKLLSDFTVSEELFKLVKLLAARSGNKIDYTKIGSVSAIPRQKIAAYMQLLEQTLDEEKKILLATTKGEVPDLKKVLSGKAIVNLLPFRPLDGATAWGLLPALLARKRIL